MFRVDEKNNFISGQKNSQLFLTLTSWQRSSLRIF